jgi:hypothetical protein
MHITNNTYISYSGNLPIEIQNHPGFKFLVLLTSDSYNQNIPVSRDDEDLNLVYKQIDPQSNNLDFLRNTVDLLNVMGCMNKLVSLRDHMPKEWLDGATRDKYRYVRRSGVFALIISEVNTYIEKKNNFKRLSLKWFSSI